jgi:hypothetical protein
MGGAGGGIWTPNLEAIPAAHSSGDVALTGSFFAASFPFFSLWVSFACRVKKSLAGDEMNEWENSQLSILRQNAAWRVLERVEALDSENSQMPSVWWSKAMERWKKENSNWGYAALFMSKLLASFLAMVKLLSPNLLFSFFQSPVEEDLF